jgi:phosphomannomutase
VGIALFLTHLAETKLSCRQLRETYPAYFMSKNKIVLTPDIHVDDLLKKIAAIYKNEQVNLTDGVKIDFKDEWVHLRKSNTEPIIRIYTEAPTQQAADALALRIIDEIKAVIAM